MAQSVLPASSNEPRTSRVNLRAAQFGVGLIPLLFVPGLNEPDLPPRLLLLQITTLIMALGWLRKRYPLHPCPLYLPAIVYFLILSSSAFWALNPFRSTYQLSKHLTFFFFFLTLLHTLDQRNLPALLRSSALAGTLVAILGIGEYLGLIPHWIPSTGRPSSTFMFRNLAAHYLVTNLPLSGLLFLISHRWSDRLLAGLSSVFMFVFLLYIRGRGSWVGLFFATILSLVLWTIANRKALWEAVKSAFDRQALIIAVIAFLLIGILGPLPAGFQEGHTQRFDEKKTDITSALTSIITKGGDRGRLQMWYITLNMVSDAPLLGVGLGNWELVYPLYDYGRNIDPTHNPLRPHNDLLWVWAEEGTLGLLAYLALLCTFLGIALRIWRQTSDSHDHLTTLMCSITVLAMIGDGMFNFPRERIPPSMLSWLAFAIMGLLIKKPSPISPPEDRPTGQTRWILILIPVLLIASIGITLRRIGFDYYYIKTFRAFHLKDNAALIQESSRALAFGPFNHQIFIMQGEGYVGSKNYDLAEQSYNRCLVYHPNFANTYNNLGHLYDQKNQYKEAIHFYRKALDLVPGHHIARCNMGITFKKMGQIDSAIVAYQKTGSVSYTKPFFNLAAIYKEMGQLDSAFVYYEKALSGPSPTLETYFNLGNLYAEQHEFEKAIEAYSQFLANFQEDSTYVSEARKGLSEAYSGLGVQVEQKGQFDRALALYKTAIVHWPENALNWYNMGNAYRGKQSWNEAIQAYLESLARDSTSVNTYNNLGLTYSEQGKSQQAIGAYRQALQFQPEQSTVHLNLANTYIATGRITKAIRSYNIFLKHWEGNPATAADVRKFLKELQ